MQLRQEVLKVGLQVIEKRDDCKESMEYQRVGILRWCFSSMDVLSVYTESEFDVCGICVRLSTFSES
jgi:hypothetical protein